MQAEIITTILKRTQLDVNFDRKIIKKALHYTVVRFLISSLFILTVL